MSARSETTWKLPHYLGVCAIIFVFQVALIFLFSDASIISEKEDSPAVISYWNLEDDLEKARKSLAQDASLLSRVHDQSMSGALWNRSVNVEREILTGTKLLSTSSALTSFLEKTSFGNSLLELPDRDYIRTQHLAGSAFFQHMKGERLHVSMPSQMRAQLSEAERVKPFPFQKTRVIFSDSLQKRVPEKIKALPALPHTNLISSTVMRLGLDKLGWARSVLLISNSISQADEKALEWIREIRFRPLNLHQIGIDHDVHNVHDVHNDLFDHNLDWGEITIHWANFINFTNFNSLEKSKFIQKRP